MRSSRLETRAKEFRTGASPRAYTNPEGEMKVKDVFRGLFRNKAGPCSGISLRHTVRAERVRFRDGASVLRPERR